jgi:excisionase family DNA binding protein
MTTTNLLTAKQVAAELKVHINTVWKYILNGQLKAHKLGSGPRGHWRVRREDLEAFLQGAGEEHGQHTDKNDGEKSAVQVASPAPTPNRKNP